MSFRFFRGKIARKGRLPSSQLSRPIEVEALEERSTPATITGGTGPGGFEFTNGSSELEIWLDATDVNANGTTVANGALVSNWQDKSGNDHDFDSILGDPNYVTSSTHGLPAVNFDGDDVLRTNATTNNPRNFI